VKGAPSDVASVVPSSSDFSVESARPRFPALDPEPPPRPLWQRFAVASVAVLVAAGLSAIGLLLANGNRGTGSAARGPASARSGRVLSLTELGALVDSRPDGRDAHTLSGPNQFQLTHLPSASPDGRLVVFSDGRILDLGSGQPTWRAGLGLQPNQLVPTGRALSAEDNAVVVLTEGSYFDQSTVYAVSVVDARTRASTSVGNGSYAAGDPQVPGAFVAAALPPEPIVGVKNSLTPDSELDLRDVGRPAVKLVSATSLETDIGLNPTTPVALFPDPSSSGALVAVVVVDLLQPAGSNSGLVVLDRNGSVVAIETPGLGPISGPLPAWSPDGSRLAYASQGPTGPVIDLWSVGGTLATRPIPSNYVAAHCLWSPAGDAVLCDSAVARSGSFQQSWNVADVGSEASYDLPGPGFPVVWYRG
jgi:hypothetical protein